MKKTLKRELMLFVYINNLPVLMIFLGLTLCYLYFNYHTFWSPFFYYFIIGLFLFLPFFGIRKLPWARKMLTMIFGIIMIFLLLIYSIDELDFIFLIAGIGGVIFFIQDYLVQRKHSYDIRTNGLYWASQRANMKKYLNSKCSRQAFLRTIYCLDKGVNNRKVTYTMVEKIIHHDFGYRWYHFFPDSSRPLIGVLFPSAWRKFRNFLAKNNITI